MKWLNLLDTMTPVFSKADLSKSFPDAAIGDFHTMAVQNNHFALNKS